MLLSAYDYSIKYKSTSAHGNVDGLSRLPTCGSDSEEQLHEENVFSVRQLEALPTTVTQLQQMTRRDRLLSKVLRYTKSGWPATVSEALKPYYRRQDEISTEDDCYTRCISYRVLLSISVMCEMTAPIP